MVASYRSLDFCGVLIRPVLTLASEVLSGAYGHKVAHRSGSGGHISTNGLFTSDHEEMVTDQVSFCEKHCYSFCQHLLLYVQYCRHCFVKKK